MDFTWLLNDDDDDGEKTFLDCDLAPQSIIIMIITLILKLYAREDVVSRVLLSKRGREIESKNDTWGPFDFEDHAMVSREDGRCRSGSNV